MKTPRAVETAVLICLMIVMVATRFHHVGDVLHLPDASMALFFLGGLYLRRYALYVLMLGLAVAIDYVAIRQSGLDFFQHYCVTPAYCFLLLSYAVLWVAGRLCASRLRPRPRELALTWCVAVVAAALSFLVSNGAFYWWGGRYTDPHWAQYLQRVAQWGPLFVRTTVSYIAVALLVHYALARWRGPRAVALRQP
ncbi:MAG TPA: hypothetical protein VGC74_15810 [Stenotrophomonas sp.]|jgi:hypothetical protein